VTHDHEETLAVSDEMVVMRTAAIAQIGALRQLYDAPNDRFVADFIGEAPLFPLSDRLRRGWDSDHRGRGISAWPSGP